MNRRTLVGAAFAATFALAATGCGAGTAPADTDANGVTQLSFAGWALSATPEFQTLADAFNASQAKYKVSVKEYDATNYDTQMTADLAAGSAPDLYPIKNQRSFYTYAAGKQLADVSDIAAELGSDASIKANTLEGKTYAIPYRQDAMILYYNVDLFKKAGVTTPDGSWTWDDYSAKAEELSTKLKGAGVDAKGTYQHAWQSLVQGFATAQTPDASILSGNYDYMRPYYERALKMQSNGSMETYGTLTTNKLTYQAQFGTQKAAMMPMGTWYAGMLVTQQSKGDAQKFTWGIAPVPQRDASTTGRDKTPVTFGDPTAIGINSKASGAKLEGAKQFLRFVSSEKGGKALTSIGITPYALTDANVTNFFATAGMPTDELSKWAYSTRETKPDNPVSKNTAAVQNMLLEAHTAVMSGSTPLDSAITSAQNKAKNELLK